VAAALNCVEWRANCNTSGEENIMSRITKIQVGSIEVVSLTDGTTEFTNDLFPNADDAEISKLLAQANKKTVVGDINAIIVKTGDDTVLVDTGPGDLFGPTCGFLQEAMSEADTSPEDITRLFLTHLHPDHIGGAVTKDGEAVFPNAQVLVSEVDHKFWSDPSNVSGNKTNQQWQQLAMSVLNAYQGRVEQIVDGASLTSGVTAMALPGHTPGHFGFRADDGNSSYVHVGDIVHAQVLQLPNPDISILYDIDPDTARSTRKRVLDMLATDGVRFSDGHIQRPTIGVLKRAGSGYRFAPE
jgi:glyoxylase-like metal-dependent hydrolase (beta-lactamase superfamily II)